MPKENGRDYVSRDDYPPGSMLGHRTPPGELPIEPASSTPAAQREAAHPAWSVAFILVAVGLVAAVMAVILFSPQGWRWAFALVFLAAVAFLWGKGPKEQPGFVATWFFILAMVILGVIGLDLLPR
jgi:hypothetical protein